MATIWGPNIVTDGLVLSLDAGNVESYAPAGTIPQKSESIASAWENYGSNQANYTVVGDDDVTLTSGTGWYGYFPSTVATTGYYTVAFEYSCDDPGTSGSYNFVINNNGVMDDDYNSWILATTTVQTFTKTVNITSTGTSQMFVRRDYGTNIKVRNFRFYKSDSAGNSIEWHDLSGNGYDADVGTAVTFSSTNGGGLTTLREENTSNTAITGTFSLSSANYTWEIWFTNNGSQGGDASAFGVHSGNVITNGFRAQPLIQTSVASSWVNVVTTAAATSSPTQVIQRRNGTLFNGFVNGAISDTDTGGSGFGTFTSYSMNDISHTSSGSGWNGTYYLVKMYNRALTDAEVLQNYNAHKGRFGL